MVHNSTQRIFGSFIAPDPNLNVLWMDLSEDIYGSIIKVWNGTDYVKITNGVDDNNGHVIYDNSQKFPSRGKLVFSGASVIDDPDFDATIVYGLKGERGFKGDKGDTGIQGPQGPAGDTGVSGVTYRGDYSETETYVEKDVVRSIVDGNAYYCFLGPVLGVEPSTGSSNWNIFVMKGAKGDTGEQGIDGKSAYEYAVESGYTGTELEFAEKLAKELTAENISYNTTNVKSVLDTIINAIVTPPEYIQPIASITNIAGSYELGSEISINITQSFTQNDAGSRLYDKIYKDGVLVSSISTYSETLSVGSSTSYYGTIEYGDGPIKQNNLGIDDPTGAIQAGIVTSGQRVISGYRNMFYGVSLPISTSAQIRSLQYSKLNPVNNTTASLPIPVGATSISFCYPKSLGIVLSIKDQLGMDVKSAFTLTEVSVDGANSYTPITYYCYNFTPPSAFSQTNNYTITI